MSPAYNWLYLRGLHLARHNSISSSSNSLTCCLIHTLPLLACFSWVAIFLSHCKGHLQDLDDVVFLFDGQLMFLDEIILHFSQCLGAGFPWCDLTMESRYAIDVRSKSCKYLWGELAELRELAWRVKQCFSQLDKVAMEAFAPQYLGPIINPVVRHKLQRICPGWIVMVSNVAEYRNIFSLKVEERLRFAFGSEKLPRSIIFPSSVIREEVPWVEKDLDLFLFLFLLLPFLFLFW